MKVTRILTISFCIIIILSKGVFASGLENIIQKGEKWEEVGKEHTGTTINTDILETTSNEIYNLFLAIATVTAVIVGAILGIQYMTAGIEKKVEVKESLYPYLISCIVAFGSLGIWKLVISIFRSF